MRRIRPFLFWLFVILFFSTSSGVLFYTFGYRFNFERGIFVYTGSISIKATPQTVDIRIDDELIPQAKLGIINRSIHIGGLTPGEHFVEVSAPGYLPWSKKTTVQSGLSTEFWNVFLVKENNTPETIAPTAGAVKVFQARKQGTLAVAKEQGTTLTVDILDTTAETAEQVFSLPDATLPADGKENIEWSPDDRKLLIPVEQAGAQSYYVVDIASKESISLLELAKNQVARSVHNPRWDPVNRNFLLYLANGVLNRIDAGSADATPLFIKNHIRDYNFSGQDIYYLSNDNGIIYQIPGSSADKDPIQVTTTSLSLLPDSDYTLILYDGLRLTLREEKTGKLWVYNKVSDLESFFHVIAESGVEGIQFSDDGKKLLFFTTNEISVYFLRDWEAQPLRTRDSSFQIARFSKPIKNVVWAEDYEHVIFSSNGSAKIIEIDNRDKRNMADLATFSSPLLQILPRFDENFVYFVTASDENTDAVSRITFAERLNFLGF
jgi:hypothetical protein